MLGFTTVSSTQRPSGCCIASELVKNQATCIPCRSVATVDEFRDGIFTPRAGLLHPRIRCWSLFIQLIIVIFAVGTVCASSSPSSGSSPFFSSHHWARRHYYHHRCPHHRRHHHHMNYQQPHCRHHQRRHQSHCDSNALAYIMLWVAGGICVTASAVTATAATTCDFTYFTYLLYLLTYFTYIPV